MRIRKLRTARVAGLGAHHLRARRCPRRPRGDFDVVHFHSFASSAFCMLPKLRGRRIVTTADRIEWQDAKWSRFTRWFLRYCEWAAVRFSDALLAVSQALKDDLLQRHAPGLPHRPGVERRHPSRCPRPIEVLAELGLRPGRYFVVVGRLVPEKGVDVAIAAQLALVRAGETRRRRRPRGGGRHPGGPAARPSSSSSSQAAPAGERIRFLGIQDPVGRHAALRPRAPHCVAPSYQEGQPLVVAEAMASGCCIVASDIPAHLELLADTALIFPRGRRRRPRRRHAQACSPIPTRRTRSARRGKARFETGDYSWDTAAETTESVLATTRRALTHARIGSAASSTTSAAHVTDNAAAGTITPLSLNA